MKMAKLSLDFPRSLISHEPDVRSTLTAENRAEGGTEEKEKTGIGANDALESTIGRKMIAKATCFSTWNHNCDTGLSFSRIAAKARGLSSLQTSFRE